MKHILLSELQHFILKLYLPFINLLLRTQDIGGMRARLPFLLELMYF